MKNINKRFVLFFFVAACLLFLNGCAILNLPFKIAGGTLEIVKTVFNIAQKLPKPPPGAF